MNVELLQKVKEKILAEPSAVDMDLWSSPSSSTPCGTVACIGGWALLLAPKSPGLIPVRTLLDIDKSEASKLFFNWPLELLFALNRYSHGTPEYAAIVAARIDRFIETDGAE